MILSFDEYQQHFKQNSTRLKRILNYQSKAPHKYQINTEHFSNLAALAPYIYYSALVRKHLDNNSSILDWGAFLGQITYLLQDDFDVTAYNPVNDDNIQYWHKKFKIKKSAFDQGYTNRQLNFAPSSFDAVISSGVLEHTFEYGISDTSALINLNNVLKPSGLLFIWNLPAKNALAEKLAMRKKRWKHIVRYDLDEILTKLNMCGFDVVEIENDELLYTKLAKVFKMVSPLRIHTIDHRLCNLPLLKNYAHHFTIVAKKIDNFPVNPARSGYTTYLS